MNLWLGAVKEDVDGTNKKSSPKSQRQPLFRAATQTLRTAGGGRHEGVRLRLACRGSDSTDNGSSIHPSAHLQARDKRKEREGEEWNY